MLASSFHIRKANWWNSASGQDISLNPILFFPHDQCSWRVLIRPLFFPSPVKSHHTWQSRTASECARKYSTLITLLSHVFRAVKHGKASNKSLIKLLSWKMLYQWKSVEILIIPRFCGAETACKNKYCVVDKKLHFINRKVKKKMTDMIAFYSLQFTTGTPNW